LFDLGAGRNGQPRDHLAQLLTGGNVSKPDFAQVGKIEQSQALWEEFSIDDALAKPGDHPETDAARQFVERGTDAAEIV
jgi:hypothetical protein